MNIKMKIEACKLTQEFLCDKLVEAFDTKAKEETFNEILYDLLNYTRHIQHLKKIVRKK